MIEKIKQTIPERQSSHPHRIRLNALELTCLTNVNKFWNIIFSPCLLCLVDEQCTFTYDYGYSGNVLLVNFCFILSCYYFSIPVALRIPEYSPPFPYF